MLECVQYNADLEVDIYISSNEGRVVYTREVDTKCEICHAIHFNDHLSFLSIPLCSV